MCPQPRRCAWEPWSVSWCWGSSWEAASASVQQSCGWCLSVALGAVPWSRGNWLAPRVNAKAVGNGIHRAQLAAFGCWQCSRTTWETLIESPASLSPALNETPPGQHIKLDLCTTSVMNIRGGGIKGLWRAVQGGGWQGWPSSSVAPLPTTEGNPRPPSPAGC